jgi:hypothetical protein
MISVTAAILEHDSPNRVRSDWGPDVKSIPQSADEETTIERNNITNICHRLRITGWLMESRN